jgi:glycine/D-amino acid oxidase-like deaminating enzyme
LDDISRRTFLASVAALPIAARLDARTSSSSPPPRIAVVGAGAFGGWTALHLTRLGAKVELIDAWGPGNTRSSSGGDTRVIRAIYGTDRTYVEMVKRAFELWDGIRISSDEPIYLETGVIWMHRGDDAYVRSSLPVMESLGFPVEKIEVGEAVKRYPQISFRGIKSVWLEKRAGALSARRACVAVRDAFEKAGGSYRTASVKPGAIRNGAMNGLRLADGSHVEADAYVFACGPWLGHVFPEVVGDRIRPTRQEVFYFGVPSGSERFAPAHMPIWIDFGARIIYGLPDIHGRGFKVADDTRGPLFDPTNGERKPTANGLARARQLLATRFPDLANAPLLSSEVCQYENSPDGNLIVDKHPGAKNVWLIGGGSGHGFKLSPAVGEMTADAVMSGKEPPKMFALARLRAAAKRSTQFDRKK